MMTWDSVSSDVGLTYQGQTGGRTSGRVYVPCIYPHARWIYRRRLRSLLLRLCDVCRAVINSLVC